MAYEKVQNLLWIDMEMTGLDVSKEVIIEVACIVTDLNFRELDCFETVVKQPQSYLDSMDAWNTEHHTKSGLAAKVPAGMEPDMVEAKLIDLINKHFPESQKDPKKRPIMAGNSIAQDKLFIDKYFKNLSARLHYRMVDVSSFKVLMNNKYNLEYKKQNSHRALDDIRESIGELKYYLQHVAAPSS